MKRKKFHQLIHLQRGPVNTAIIDFLKCNLFQVRNENIDPETRQPIGMDSFLQELEEAHLLIDVEEELWIPCLDLQPTELEDIQCVLEIEDGTDISLIQSRFSGIPFSEIHYYGEGYCPEELLFSKVTRKKKDFDSCIQRATIQGVFSHIYEAQFCFNRALNPCWGKKIAITRDHQVRPCIMSTHHAGNLKKTDMSRIMSKLEKFWKITKDQIEGCRDCELRYVCFDCREIAWREKKNLNAPSSLCQYDPYRGEWKNG